ncbi:oligosaccharide flippase family protein [Patescibacteria group bacterium]|nr:oligosaccharide flippase family protein [Patescibacteria group bacterium]
MRKKFLHALLVAERVLRTDIKYLARGGFWLIIGQVGTVLFGFLMAYVFANLMEPEKYGVYKYILSIIGLTGTLSLIGLGKAVNRAAAQGVLDALPHGFSASLRWSIGSIVAAGCIGTYYLWNDNLIIGFAIFFGGAISPLIAAASLYDNFLSGLQEFKTKTLYNLLRSIVPIGILVGVVSITNNPLLLSTAYFSTTFIATYFCYHRIISQYSKTTKHLHHEMLSYGKHLSGIGIFATAVAQLDRILVFSQLGGTALALYAFSEVAPDQMRSTAGIVNSLAFSKMTQQDYDQIRRTIARKSLILFAVGLTLAGIYIALAPYLFSLFFPQYLAAIPYSQAYALTVPLVFAGALYSQALVSHAKKKLLYINSLSTSLLRLILLAVLITPFGIWGVVWATLGYYAFGLILLLVTFYFFDTNTGKRMKPGARSGNWTPEELA